MKPKFTDPDVPRYTERPLPAYRHLPFQNAHPFLDEDGHSFGEQLIPTTSFEANNWRDCPDYLYSIDLFNHGFWWEAHERLKQVSIGAGRDSAAGRFVQGLIQVAAALLKHFMGEDEGAATLAELGLGNLQSETGTYLGIDVPALTAAVRACLESGEDIYPSIRLAAG